MTSLTRILGIPDDAAVWTVADTGECPRCGTPFSMRRPIEANALSRCTRGADDAPLYVCTPCGHGEAMEQYAGALAPVTAWVTPPTTD